METLVDSDLVKPKRPKWVWAISIFYLISAGYTLLSFYLVYSKSIPLNTAQSEYFAGLTTFDHALTITIGSLNVLAAISLFRLMKVALYLFTASFSMGVLTTIWHIVFKGFVQALSGSGGIVGVALGWCLIAAVYSYTWSLYKNKVLT